MFRVLLRALGCVWLFCGFLIAASVDRVPDPPALQPHAEAKHTPCVQLERIDPVAPGMATSRVPEYRPCALRRSAAAFDSILPETLFVFTYCSADNSPPRA